MNWRAEAVNSRLLPHAKTGRARSSCTMFLDEVLFTGIRAPDINVYTSIDIKTWMIPLNHRHRRGQKWRRY